MSKPSPSRVASMYLVAKKWKKLPPGWTDKSVDKFWDSLTKGTPQHKVWDCISKMTEPFGEEGAGAFCGGLADWKMPGWRQKNKKESPEARATAKKYWKNKIKSKKAAKKRKAIYVALFIPRTDSAALQRFWVRETGIDILPKHFLHHITLSFKPSVDEMLKLKDYIGKEVPVRITGWAADQRAQAFAIKCTQNIPMCNTFPHVTVATDAATKPFYSNELLAKGPVHPVRGGPSLSLRLGFFDGKEARFNFAETIYEDLI